MASPSSQKVLGTDRGKQVLAILRVVLNQCDQYEPGMLIDSSEFSENMTVLHGRFAEHSHIGFRAPWTFEVPVLLENRAYIRFSFVCGELCGEGYLGKLKKQDGRWLVTSWRRIWIS